MLYQNLGRSGVKVSRLSLGSWVTFGKQVDLNEATRLMSIARDGGVNFFDNAEVYAQGQSEQIMGEVLGRLNWSRLSYLVSTKFFWGIEEGINSKNTLNRKYLLSAMEGSLKRLKLDYVDLVYCHRADPQTPMEEVVRAMNDLIQRGQALYWGTSEWSAVQIEEAFQVCEKYGFVKPIVEQPQYNLFFRKKVEVEFQSLYQKYGLGLTTWSPLASGLLSGKYLKGIPDGSRLSLNNMQWMKEELISPQRMQQVGSFSAVAQELGMKPSQLAIAWCLKNKNVSSVILGASRASQLEENLQTMSQIAKLTPEILQKIEATFPIQ
jgi:voltage-dependent potassium channel beta subunit